MNVIVLLLGALVNTVSAASSDSQPVHSNNVRDGVQGKEMKDISPLLIPMDKANEELSVESAQGIVSEGIESMKASSQEFLARIQNLVTKINIGDRNFIGQQEDLKLIEQSLSPDPSWSYFIYNCACKTAVPIFHVKNCNDRPALLQITDIILNGDSYNVYANEQLVLKTPSRRPLGWLTFSLSPNQAMLSRDWSHGELPVEPGAEFNLQIIPRHVTYEFGIGAIRLLPLDVTKLFGKLFIVTTKLPYDQADDACAAYENGTLAVLKNQKEVKAVALALSKAVCNPTLWIGGIGCKKAISRLFLNYNPLTEQAFVDRVDKTDASYRSVLCRSSDRPKRLITNK